MLKCLCGEPATHLLWDTPRCDEHIETAKRCFRVWPPAPDSVAAKAIEPIPVSTTPDLESPAKHQ
jgi:hypothetical protein